jgi:hypothetical protein
MDIIEFIDEIIDTPSDIRSTWDIDDIFRRAIAINHLSGKPITTTTFHKIFWERYIGRNSPLPPKEKLQPTTDAVINETSNLQKRQSMDINKLLSAIVENTDIKAETLRSFSLHTFYMDSLGDGFPPRLEGKLRVPNTYRLNIECEGHVPQSAWGVITEDTN